MPEIDEVTGEAFHEREDHWHILKRIWKHTREEGPAGTDLQGFDDAMRDPKTGLTHAALTGERKQSVQDVERMLSFLVAKFLQENGYQQESKYVETVARSSRREGSNRAATMQKKLCHAEYGTG